MAKKVEFSKEVQAAITRAQNNKKSATVKEKILLRMASGDWVDGGGTGNSLAQISHRFSGYLFVLKDELGECWTKRLNPKRPKGASWWQYRLLNAEEYKTWNSPK